MKRPRTLSIIIPCFNERTLLPRCLKKVERAPSLGLRKEIILVDDRSTDGTREWLRALARRGKHKVYFHPKNRGKGAAVKTGFARATGDILLIQDADLEYEPRDYPALLKPFFSGAKVVYGSRQLGPNRHTHSSFTFWLGGIVVTLTTSILFWQWITDEPTCYKVFSRDVIGSMHIDGERFEWEPEVTAKVLRRGIRIREVPIHYYPRSVAQGKKIGWKDGIQALWTLVKYRFVSVAPPHAARHAPRGARR